MVGEGIASAGTVLSWQDGSKIIKLSIAHQRGSPDRNFADKDDSGALVFTETNSGNLNAIMLLHDSYTRRDKSVYTPMWAAMETVAKGMGRGSEIFANPAY